MHLGPHSILIVMGLEFRPDLSAPDVAAATERLHGRIRKAVEGSTDAQLSVIEAASPGGRALDKAA
jgi:hypothetical protein